jgi:hypothetical protein
MAPRYKMRPTDLSTAHQALYERQEKLGRYLSYKEVAKVLLSAPGFTFGKGNSSQDCLEDLAKHNFIALDRKALRVFVFSL